MVVSTAGLRGFLTPNNQGKEVNISPDRLYFGGQAISAMIFFLKIAISLIKSLYLGK